MSLRPILMVDDDSDDRFLVKTAFEDLGYFNHVSFVESGEKALNYLSEALTGDGLPTLIVLDLNMPRMTGTDVLKAIKAVSDYKDIHVIIFSTAVNEPQKKECLKYGAGSYLVKPLDYNGFLETAQAFHTLAAAG